MTAKLRFRQGWTCSCVAISLPLVEEDMLHLGLITQRIDIFQLGYNLGVDASAGTHDAGGCTDVGQYSDAQIAVWRDWGWTMQHRTNAQGFSTEHAHGWPFGCPHLSPQARAQNSQWKKRQNGLAGNAHGPVRGPWPVQNWKIALKRKEADMPTAKEVAEAVLTLDGLIENVFTGNPANKDVALRTALIETYRRLAAVDDQLDRVATKIDAIANAVHA